MLTLTQALSELTLTTLTFTIHFITSFWKQNNPTLTNFGKNSNRSLSLKASKLDLSSFQGSNGEDSQVPGAAVDRERDAPRGADQQEERNLAQQSGKVVRSGEKKPDLSSFIFLCTGEENTSDLWEENLV